MGKNSKIQWTTHTWNPWTGCHPVSAGCQHCYMFRDAKRFGRDPNKVIRSRPQTFNLPLRIKEPAYIFVNSWSDFFIEEADPWRVEAWEIMRKTPHLTYQILTKRPDRIESCLPNWWGLGYRNAFNDQIDYYRDNIWLGVTMEVSGYPRRLTNLLIADAKLRFISAEPLLEDIVVNDKSGGMLGSFDWIIAGAESGPLARETKIEWFRSLRDFCIEHKIPFFLKQMRINGKLVKMPELDGKIWNQVPEGNLVNGLNGLNRKSVKLV